MATNGHALNGGRTEPMYSFTEAAHLADVSTGTVRNWLFGYSVRDKEVGPLFSTPPDQGPMVSFLQLIEIVVAGKFRKAEHVSFQGVRKAYENARTEYNLDFPFAHLKLEAIGGHIVHRLHADRPGTSLQALDEPQQWTLPGLILDMISQLDYDYDLAARWYPVGKEVPIIVDPKMSSGIPTVLGRGVTVGALRKRWKSGLRIEFIAEDFGLEPSLVEQVLQYAEQVAA